METQPFIIDEAGMCVVNTKSITDRFSVMEDEEIKYVANISGQFLTNLVRLAHCPDVNKVKEAAVRMLRLLLNNVYDNHSIKNKFVSFIAKSELVEAPSSQKIGQMLMGSLDPVAILSHLLDDGSGDKLSGSISSMFSVLKGYNPLKLDDLVVLEKCNGGVGCKACISLQQTLELGDNSPPVEALLYFLRCMNHQRLNFGGDLESAKASSTFNKNYNNPKIIIIQLRNLLLNCLDFLGGGTLSNIIGNDENEMWLQSLHNTVNNIPVQERAFISQVYCFLIFSRHRQNSGDCIKQFLYTIFARFLYSATEIMFCATENASIDVDDGKFLKYLQGLTNTVVMSSPLMTTKAFLTWRNEGSSVAPILSLLTGQWRQNYQNVKDLTRVGSELVECISDMAKPTRLGVSRIGGTTSGLDSVRSVRQAERYIPFGFVSQHRGSLTLSSKGVSMQARNHSTGDNIACNCFHVLSGVRGAECLGPDNNQHQATFEKILSPKGVENGTGQVLGLITSYIDKTILGCSVPRNKTEFEKRVTQFVQDIIFTKTLLHEDTVNNVKKVPHSKFWNNPVVTGGDQARCLDTRTYTLFLLWQKPSIPDTNVSALTASQLELLMSRGPEWVAFITRIFFIMERVSFQLADAIVKNVKGGEGKFILPSQFQEATQAQRLIDNSLNAVYRDWTNAESRVGEIIQLTGFKAQYTMEVYNLLYKIVIEHDMDPSIIINHSEFLCNIVNSMDDLLMKTIQQQHVSSSSSSVEPMDI